MPTELADPLSRDKIECGDMGWPDDREMPSIKCGDRASVESLTSRDDRCIDGAERQVPVRCHQLRDPKPIGRPDWLGHKVASRKVAEEANFGLGPDSCPKQVRDLRDDEDWDQDRPWMVQEKSAAAAVLGIVSVVGRMERSGIESALDRFAAAGRPGRA